MNNNKKITVESLKTCNFEVLDALNKLLSELDTDIPKLSEEYVRKILRSANTNIFVARNDSGLIIGMATLIVFKALSGRRATLEDIVVNKEYRGQGLGKKLLQTVMSFARKENISYIDLTSRPSRIAANNLYASSGFEKRDTNVYRFKIKNEISK